MRPSRPPPALHLAPTRPLICHARPRSRRGLTFGPRPAVISRLIVVQGDGNQLPEQGLGVRRLVVGEDDRACRLAWQPDGQRLVTRVVTGVKVGGVPGDTGR